MHGDNEWRTTSRGRVARRAAYSIGGGAVLTVLGATAASATGDADATGNTSATEMDQTLAVSDPPAPTVVELTAGVGNLGGAGANTGVNTGDGIDTGDATSSGNHSTSTLGQHAGVSGGGSGPVVVQQRGGILNLGVALANTGVNDGEDITTGSATASGNMSTSALVQLVTVPGETLGPVVIDQGASIGNVGGALANTGVNEGDGGISTGNAGASGNESTSHATQEAATDAMEAAAAVQQRTRHRNLGGAVANTGLNEHLADESVSDPEEDD